MDTFWTRFGFDDCPNFSGLSVLEIGSGEGRRAIQIARTGAKRVLGIEPNTPSYHAAIATVASLPDVAGRIDFFDGELKNLPSDELFDAAITEDTFEHVQDIPGILADIKSRMRPNGKLYIGFGPLYHAPDGDHHWLRLMLPGSSKFLIPWGHLLFTRYAFKQLSKQHGREINDTTNWPFLHLNQHSAAEFERMFAESGMKIVFLRKNHVMSPRGKLIALLERIPPLSKYCTLNLAAILER